MVHPVHGGERGTQCKMGWMDESEVKTSGSGADGAWLYKYFIEPRMYVRSRFRPLRSTSYLLTGIYLASYAVLVANI